MKRGHEGRNLVVYTQQYISTCTSSKRRYQLRGESAVVIDHLQIEHTCLHVTNTHPGLFQRMQSQDHKPILQTRTCKWWCEWASVCAEPHKVPSNAITKRVTLPPPMYSYILAIGSPQAKMAFDPGINSRGPWSVPDTCSWSSMIHIIHIRGKRRDHLKILRFAVTQASLAGWRQSDLDATYRLKSTQLLCLLCDANFR